MAKSYDIHNPTQAPRVIYDAKHVAVTILPGTTMPNIELEDKVADEFKARKGDIALSAASGRTKAFVRDVPPAKPPGSEDGGEGGEGEGANHDEEGKGAKEVVISDTKKKANALIDAADETEFNEWKEQVKGVLGKDWPGGKPRKKDLIKQLKKVK
jgi:hypothetical protein